MRAFDYSPLSRATVGFDRVFNLIDALSGEAAPGNGYPPYNIEKTGEHSYRIVMAVAGFAEADLSIIQQENALSVSGKIQAGDEGRQFLHRGIAARAFERRFELADFVRVTGAKLANGLLQIDLAREVPEAKKPRQIAIDGPSRPALDLAA